MRSAFYTLCPKHPQCGCNDFCAEFNLRLAGTRAVKAGLAALLTATTVGATLEAIAITPACAHAASCGECWNTGTPGTLSADGLDCIKCEKVSSFRLSDYRPPDNGGPGKTRGSGTRNS